MLRRPHLRSGVKLYLKVSCFVTLCHMFLLYVRKAIFSFHFKEGSIQQRFCNQYVNGIYIVSEFLYFNVLDMFL